MNGGKLRLPVETEVIGTNSKPRILRNSMYGEPLPGVPLYNEQKTRWLELVGGRQMNSDGGS